MGLNIYLVERTDEWDYDTFSAMVVAAETEADAKAASPQSGAHIPLTDVWVDSPEKLEVRLLGVATPEMERGLILASFHAG